MSAWRLKNEKEKPLTTARHDTAAYNIYYYSFLAAFNTNNVTALL